MQERRGVFLHIHKKRLICVPDMLSKKRDSALRQLFSIFMCYRVDRNVTPQYSPSLLRPFFFVLPSCNIQAAFKKMGIAEHGMENSQATQQNYQLGIHQPHTKLTYISLYAQQYNRQLTNHTMEIRAETHLSHYRARDHIITKTSIFSLTIMKFNCYLHTNRNISRSQQSISVHAPAEGRYGTRVPNCTQHMIS